jgi:hypothetical protein
MRIYLLLIMLLCFPAVMVAAETPPATQTGEVMEMADMEGMTTIGSNSETGSGMINRNPSKAISELGELYYPGAQVLNSLVCYGGGPEDVMVLMSTPDSLDKVKAYYNPKFQGKDITRTESARYYSLLRPERVAEPVGTPPAYITMLQDYADKEVLITVFQGYCAYEHFNRTIGNPQPEIKQNTDFKGGFGWDND